MMDMKELTEKKYERDLKNKHFKNKLGGETCFPTFRRLKQDNEFKASLSYILSYKLRLCLRKVYSLYLLF